MDIKEYVANRKIALSKEISSLDKKPSLAIITVGDDPASAAYVKGKKKDAAELGIEAIHIVYDSDVSESIVLDKIKELNADPGVNGIIVQLPLPKHISVDHINQTIDPKKDVDGFTPLSEFDPCTPKGIIDYLVSEHFEFKGKNAVVLGRSDIVGKPMARMLLDKDMNVTILHSKTSEEDKKYYLSHADLVVSATGRMHSLDDRYGFLSTAYLIDVGITKGEDGRLHGDFVPNLDVAYQSKVPGGVGLLTRLSLMENVILAYRRNK